MDEFWDLYDENRKPLGKTYKRGVSIDMFAIGTLLNISRQSVNKD